MAQSKKRSSASGRKRNISPKPRKMTKAESNRYESRKRDLEIVLIVAVSLFLFVCNFNVVGKVGSFLSNIMFGLFGLLSYVMPILLGLAFIFIIANNYTKRAIFKVVSTGILVFLVQMLIDIFAGFTKNNSKYGIKEIYRWSVDSKKGGGLFAGSLAYGLTDIIDVIGSVIVIITFIIVCIFFLSEGKLLESIKNLILDIRVGIKENRERRAAYNEEQARINDDKRAIREAERLKAEEQARIRHEERLQHEKELDEKRQLRKQNREEKDIFSEKKTDKKRNNDITTDTLLGPVKVTEPDFSTTDDIHEIQLNGFDPANPTTSNIVNEVKQTGDTVKELIIVEEPETEEPEEFVPQPVESSRTNDSVIKTTKQETVTPTQAYTRPVAKAPTQTQNGLNINTEKHTGYVFPPIELLTPGKSAQGDSMQQIRQTAQKLQDTLAMFGVEATVTDISQGPTVTRFELQPKMGTKVSRIKNLTDDIKLNLAAADIRIEAPIPGKAAIGIEVPNKEPVPVIFRDMIESDEFKKCDSKLAFAVGKDIAGKTIIYDIDKFPHVLIAGSTGSGKSVCINTLIMSIIYRAHPDDVKFIMIDPKVVELSVYNGIPHLLLPVVTDMKKAAATLNFAVAEMMERYKKFADKGVRDIIGYNKVVESEPESEIYKKMPYIVVIVDEFADLIISARNEVEDAICRLAALARACGIHLVLATQRPSADVITGLIKSNMPSRISFAVSSQIESRIILDIGGAEELLGKGDMLFYPKGLKKPVRLQGGFVKDEDVITVAEFLKNNNTAGYDPELSAKIESMQSSSKKSGDAGAGSDSDSMYDDMFIDVGRYIIEVQKASIGQVQRKFKMGFNRAARIMDQLAEAGVVGPDEGTKPRTINMSMSDFESFIDANGI